MIDTQALDYIQASTKNGLSREQIVQNLVGGGWLPQQAQDAVSEALQSSLAIPVPPPAPISNNSTIVTAVKSRIYRSASPLSILLAPVLIVALVVLVQNALLDVLKIAAPSPVPFYETQEYRDIQETYRDDWALYNKQIEVAQVRYDATSSSAATTRLLVCAILVLPFWILTAGVYMLLRSHYEKYRILLMPYYATSGWLLVYLLYSVSKYILDKNSAVGVYIVLGMIIAVLTVGIVAFQKYSHHSESTAV